MHSLALSRIRTLLTALACAGLLALSAIAGAANALTLTSFSPVGGSSGTTVALTGTGFASATTVQFNGTAASFSIVSDTQINATVPSSATTGPITVKTASQTVSSATNFFVGPTPYVSNVSPNGAAAGANVTISGSGFIGVTSVKFNGSSAAYTVNSSSQITATVPVGATTGAVTVTNAAGTGSWSTFYLPPVVTTFSPGGGTEGTTIQLYGTNFAIASNVQLNGVNAWFSIVDNSHLVMSVPYSATTGPITVTSIAGTSSSPSSFFVGPAPAVTSVSPAGGPPGTTITITGSKFAAVNSVLIGGVPAAYTVTSTTEITATVPGAATTGAVTVTNPTGQGIWSQVFFVGYPPMVTNFTPSAGQVGSSVTLTGSGFTGTSTVSFNGATTTAFLVNSDTQIVATVPFAAANGPISVINPAGTGVSVSSFAIMPRITSLTPASVSASGAVGTMVTVTGDHFTGASRVAFNDVSSTYTVVDDQTIHAYVPTGATTGLVSVTTLSGSANSPVVFEIIAFTPPYHSPFATWPLRSDQNVPVVAASGNQYSQTACADSTGGAYIAWQDFRNGRWDIYLQRVTGYGDIAPGWPTNGVAVCSMAGTHDAPRVVADQVGGVYVVWEDIRSGSQGYDIYASHILADGTVATGWNASGNKLCGAYNDQTNPTISTDGSGGAFIGWQDYRNNQWFIYATRVSSNGAIANGWDTDGLMVSSWNYHNYSPNIVPDGTGGGFISWYDNNSYASVQRFTGGGLIASGWPAGGLRITNYYGSGSQVMLPDGAGNVILVTSHYYYAYANRILSTATLDPAWGGGRCLGYTYSNGSLSAVSDGQGGVLAAWEYSSNMLAQHVTATGSIASGWPSNGYWLRSASNTAYWPQTMSDGLGGMIVTWYDNRSGYWDIYAQRILGTGSIASSWNTNGNLVCSATNDQSSAVIVPSSIAGGIIAWADTRNGSSNYDVYAQNITLSGKPGNLEPHITSVADVKNDQGGKLRVTWHACPLDTLPTAEISTYGVWRLVSSTSAQAALARGARMAAASDSAVIEGSLRRVVTGAQETWWEGIGSVPARAQSTYSFVVETLADSTAAGNANTIYMVDAHATIGPYFWSSAADSGHSVDNLAPGTPLALSTQYGSSSTSLHWTAVTDRDLAHYEVHRGPIAGFTPSASSLVATTADTAFADTHSGEALYKVVAVDIHGNAGAPVTSTIGAWLDVEHELPRELALGAATPSPTSTAAHLALRLPTGVKVAASVYDAAGRRVRVLADATLSAGVHDLAWDLADDAGRRAAAGLYFVRVEAGRTTFMRRLVVVR